MNQLFFWFLILSSIALARSPVSPKPGIPVPPGETAMQKALEALKQNLGGVLLSGQTDQDFVTILLKCEEGVTELAKVELQYGKDPGTKAVAEAVQPESEKRVAGLSKRGLSSH